MSKPVVLTISTRFGLGGDLSAGKGSRLAEVSSCKITTAVVENSTTYEFLAHHAVGSCILYGMGS
jgi:hypothetical protein